MHFPPRTRRQLQADSINDAINELTTVRNELDPGYSPPIKDNSLDEWITVLLVCGIDVVILVFIIALIRAAFS